MPSWLGGAGAGRCSCPFRGSAIRLTRSAMRWFRSTRSFRRASNPMLALLPCPVQMNPREQMSSWVQQVAVGRQATQADPGTKASARLACFAVSCQSSPRDPRGAKSNQSTEGKTGSNRTCRQQPNLLAAAEPNPAKLNKKQSHCVQKSCA